MNICYISNSAVPSRTANSIHTMKMCQAYARLGHQVTLLVPDWKDEIEPGVDDIHAFYGVGADFVIRMIPLLPPWKLLDFIHRAILMPFLAFSGGPTLVHSRGLTAAWGLTNLFRTPTIYESHQPLPPNSRMQRMFIQIGESAYLQALVFITHALADHMRPLISGWGRMVIAPDGVDAVLLEKARDRPEVRKELMVQCDNRRVAVYTGHLYAGRGIDLIIEVSRQMADYLFLIVGGSESDIERYRKETALLPNLKFLGFKPPAEVNLYLQAADVLLMPYGNKVLTSGGGDTTAFASPMKMFEYMAAGRPILASNLPVLREVLQDGVNAMLLPFDQPHLWCEALRRLKRENTLAETLALRSREDATQYTWENRAQRILQQAAF